MATVKCLLVPTDFSPASLPAVQYAIDLAADLGATVHLLHVVEEWDMTARYLEALCIELPGLRERVMAEADNRLTAMAAQLGAPVPILTEVREGKPADIIVDDARRKNVDLIVMGTHGRTGVSHALLGSVAERVLRTAPCAVLVVHATERRTDETVAPAARGERRFSGAAGRS